MVKDFVLSIGPVLDPDAFVCRLVDTYRALGYTVNIAGMNGSFILSFEKIFSLFKTVLGMREGIKLICVYMNNVLSISFSEAEWTGCVIALTAGIFLFFIPVFTGIIGVFRQISLPRRISTDIRKIICEM